VHNSWLQFNRKTVSITENSSTAQQQPQTQPFVHGMMLYVYNLLASSSGQCEGLISCSSSTLAGLQQQKGQLLHHE
jgi:hypothetical protein